MTPAQWKIIQAKNKFKTEFAQKLSIIHLKHMFETIKKMNKGVGLILDPNNSKDKMRAFKLREKRNKEMGRMDPCLENVIGNAMLKKKDLMIGDNS